MKTEYAQILRNSAGRIIGIVKDNGTIEPTYPQSDYQRLMEITQSYMPPQELKPFTFPEDM